MPKAQHFVKAEQVCRRFLTWYESLKRRVIWSNFSKFIITARWNTQFLCAIWLRNQRFRFSVSFAVLIPFGNLGGNFFKDWLMHLYSGIEDYKIFEWEAKLIMSFYFFGDIEHLLSLQQFLWSWLYGSSSLFLQLSSSNLEGATYIFWEY